MKIFRQAKFITSFVFLIFIFSVSASAQTTDEQCVQYGWVEDKDPNGTTVRDKPGLKGNVLAVLPFPKEVEETVTVEIIGYSNGWLKIRLAVNGNGKIFEGAGWILAKKVKARVETNNSKPATMFALPKKTSKKAGTIPDEENLTIVGVSCFGFKVSYNRKTGWLSTDDYCGNPLTTCP